MNRSLSFDSIVAALAVLSVNIATLGCSTKAAPASERSAPATTPAIPNASAAPEPNPAPPPMNAASAAGPAEQRVDGVDAGRELKAAPARDGAKNPSASCGAQGCSPDMKKNG
jgi:hypothetical protein